MFLEVCGFGVFLKDVISNSLLEQGGLALAKIEEYRSFFMTGSLILILIAAVPTLGLFIRIPDGSERFSELWLLGPTRKAEGYPFNVRVNESYLVYVGVANRLGRSAYYRVYVKFRNQSQPAPSSFGPIENRVPSSLPSLFDVRAFVADEGVWEMPLTFSFDYVFNEMLMRVEFTSLNMNGVAVDLDDQVIVWDAVNKDFLGFLFFEVWLYDADVDCFGYHGRFVSLKLNMTV